MLNECCVRLNLRVVDDRNGGVEAVLPHPTLLIKAKSKSVLTLPHQDDRH